MENKSHKKRSLYRIEDFISLYKKGENISLNVNLRIEKYYAKIINTVESITISMDTCLLVTLYFH